MMASRNTIALEPPGQPQLSSDMHAPDKESSEMSLAQTPLLAAFLGKT
jgi:hypothetical protein